VSLDAFVHGQRTASIHWLFRNERLTVPKPDSSFHENGISGNWPALPDFDKCHA
jgi:hypothetical protein